MTTTHRITFPQPETVTLEVTELPALDSGQVLVEVEWSLISAGTELTCLHQRYAPGTHWANWVKFPFHPGYSCAGRIVALGESVTGWSVGDRVAWRGAHCRLQAVASSRLYRVPDGVDTADAAWIGLLKIVQVGARAAGIRFGERAVVVGCGILGQLAVQYCALAGCETVVAVDIDTGRLDHASRYGATATVQGAVGEVADAVIEACGGERPDLVMDVTGAAPVLPACLALVRDFGRVVLLGDPGDPDAQHITKDIITRGVRLIGAHDCHASGGTTRFDRWTEAAMYDYAMRLLDSGRLRVAELVSHRFAAPRAAEAYAIADDRGVPTMGLLLDWRDLPSSTVGCNT